MMTNFEEYIRQGEPDKKEKSQIWQTAIGLQQVDGLKPSAYLIETAKQNIEGDITFDEVKSRIDNYYKTQSARQSDDDRTEEADKVSARIAEILSEKTFTFSPLWYINIHRRLFIKIYKIAGKIRDYNITKSEWVLDGKTVFYSDAEMISATLNYDFEQEKAFNYKNLSKTEVVEHFVKFISGLWQIHAFGEGNTRTTAVFAIKYLRTFGFDVENDMFAQHSWYLRNALVRANYNDYQNKIYATQEYLLRFFGNILFGENNELKNRYLHIKYLSPENVEEKFSVNKNTPNLLGVNDDNKLDVNAGANAGVNAGVKITQTQKKILSLMQKNNMITQAEIAKKIKVNETTVYRNIEKMKQLKILERIGSDKKGHWQINSIKN
jgi:fido (protein-threonine AMPylation protein)/DNA-binding CsgD family transcriptional regulator